MVERSVLCQFFGSRFLGLRPGCGKRVKSPRCRATVSEQSDWSLKQRFGKARRATRTSRPTRQARRPARSVTPTPFACKGGVLCDLFGFSLLFLFCCRLLPPPI